MGPFEVPDADEVRCRLLRSRVADICTVTLAVVGGMAITVLAWWLKGRFGL